MKPGLPLETDRAWNAADADLAAEITALFRRCPELCGFSVQAKVFADRPAEAMPFGDEELFVTAITISPRLGKEQYADIFEQIAATLSGLIAERPQTQILLQGRTFARVFQ
jgi:hypothetical protein